MSEYYFEARLGQNGRVAMIAGGSLERGAELARLATLSGCTPLLMDDARAADFLLVDLSSEMEGIGDSLTRISHYLGTHRSTALIWSTMEVLEEIYATLPRGQFHLLVEARDVEALPILAGMF